ncbi:TetR/AcrR family transcriptional regulator [Fodinicola feengrottensis]|uniref:TetR/AcrR family transcriptional regulator n=1 Tax=Fodinicola feengrottensis TaxID=435914 RepID=A0ABN2HWW0_9ACTN
MATRGRPRAFDRDIALRQAMEVFWARGYEGTSISDLTTAIGINSPSLYAAFSCKEALFREAVELYGKIEGGTSERALTREPTARAAVEAMLRDNVSVYTETDTPPGCMVVLAATVSNPVNDGVRDFLADCRREFVDLLHRRLERGIADGDVPADADIAAMTEFYATVLHGLSIRARDGSSAATLTKVATAAMATWDALAS